MREEGEKDVMKRGDRCRDKRGHHMRLGYKNIKDEQEKLKIRFNFRLKPHRWLRTGHKGKTDKNLGSLKFCVCLALMIYIADIPQY
jgi:hypothetical protein